MAVNPSSQFVVVEPALTFAIVLSITWEHGLVKHVEEKQKQEQNLFRNRL